MLENQVRDVSEATFAVLTEREFAERRRNEGRHVIEHNGRYWEQVGAPGFFQPVHVMARLTPEEATRPTPLSWGYRAALTPETAGAANGKVAIVQLPDLASYDMDSLLSNRRNRLRKCQRLVRIVQLTGPELLMEQGYDIVVDALSRTQHKKLPSRESYLTEVKNYFRGDHWCVLAGFIDGKLGGFVDGYVVDGVAYGLHAYYAKWALPTNISTGMIFAFTQICRRLGGVHTLVAGLEAREVPQLGKFKDDLGFVVESVPIKWEMNPLAQAFIRWRRPHAYERLIGRN